ncbi:MAG: hypothetical protein O3A00_17610 [Planctomycetota bacterium]|nr:hypothetical protein [Planctomycetota bacterium]
MDFQLRSVGKTCEKSGHPLAPGEVCHSVLVERHGKMTRLDYSHEAWSGPPEDAVAYWRVQVPDATEKQTPTITTDGLMSYFEQLSEAPNTVQEQMRYVLALMLLQRRRLKLEGSRTDGDIEYLQLSGSRGDGDFEVRQQSLSDEEIEQLQSQLNVSVTSEWQELDGVQIAEQTSLTDDDL